MSTNNKTSLLVNSQLPAFVRDDHQTFVAFLEAYYEYLEQSNTVLAMGHTTERAKNFLNYIDIDKTLDDFETKLYDRFLHHFPLYIQADKSIILKNILDFYRSKGTEKAARFLMRAMFGQEIDFYFPKTDVLKASDGKWYIQKSLRVQDIKTGGVSNTNISGLEKFVGRQVIGNTSLATAVVERVDRFFLQGQLLSELVLSRITGDFADGEVVRANADSLLVTANVFGGIVSAIEVVNGGTGYSIGDPVLIISSTGSGATAQVDKISTGNVSSITVISGGAGYQNGNFLLITGAGGSGANAQVSGVELSGLYHNTSYNIVSSTISLEANTIIANAFPNLVTQYTNTSNLVVNTGSGASVTTVNLSFWVSNSNVFFETFDTLNVNNNFVTVTQLTRTSNVITVNPGLPGNIVSNSFQVIKKANANTTLANALSTFVYGNTGPAQSILVNSKGDGYLGPPTLSIIANTIITSLGILGRMNIVNSGTGYSNSDYIQFTNIPGGYGFGANANVVVNSTGSIVRTVFLPVQGQITGGSGYDQNFLPRANIVTATGTGGNVQVAFLLGYGATMVSANSTIGEVQRIRVVTGGSGYSNATADLSKSGDGTATASVTAVKGVYTYPGRYLNDDGHLSAYNFLQDRDYYQNYSYVIRIRESIENYRKVVKELIHPAGMKLFGEYTYENMNEDVATSTQLDDSDRITFRSGTYTSNSKNISFNTGGSFNLINSGVSVNSNVYIQFTTGSVTTNSLNTTAVSNSLFRVLTLNANGNTLTVTHYSSNVVTSGNARIGIIVT